MINAYTYRIKWSKQNKSYYGVRYAKNCSTEDLWHTYFTSSKEVKKMREVYGEPDLIEIRKKFSNKKEAILWETKVLNRLSVSRNKNWLNINPNLPQKPDTPTLGKVLSKETRKKISKANKGKIAHNKGKSNPIAKKRMLCNNPMKDKTIAKKVSKSLKEKYQNGYQPKNKITKTFIWECVECGTKETRRLTAKEKKKLFCGKSCAASYSNKRRYISQPPDAEQANS